MTPCSVERIADTQAGLGRRLINVCFLALGHDVPACTLQKIPRAKPQGRAIGRIAVFPGQGGILAQLTQAR
jgi:hypothetical protein